MDGSRALWQSVVNRAIIDALWPRPKVTNDNGHGGIVCEHDKHKARSWIGSRDFRHVCSLAGYDPAFVESRVRPLLEDPEAAKVFVRRLSGGESSRRVLEDAA